MRIKSRRRLPILASMLWLACVSNAQAAGEDRRNMLEQFANPPANCHPQTRWWWMGNAVTKAEISWQLRQMHDQGICGVEQITMEPVYEKGNVPYLSEDYFDLLKHAVAEARGLGMTVSLNFGGPGWVWEGDWIPPDERNQTLLSSSLVVSGPAQIDQPLSTEATLNPRDLRRSWRKISPEDRLVAVVAARLKDGRLDPNSLQVLTSRVHDRRIAWRVPEGSWQIMAFWACTYGNAVNHLDRKAMTHYVTSLGEKYCKALSDPLGNTIESLFGDSFEVPVHRNGFYWCGDLPGEFHKRKGYELIPYLPALWWNVGSISPKVRYDVNDVLHQVGMQAFFETFVSWCRAHGVKSRVQPYGFVTDILEGAGAVDIPEMEITAGEKDAVPWFDPRIGPREYVASGAHLYGRDLVSVEAYTYLHWEPYRATLEELKIASDAFLRAGANQFVNHGFLATPERDITPTRGFYPAIHISPDNVWWRYYHLLADYVARCCYQLRQGDFCADVAIYSPLANQWTQNVFNAPRWTRDFDWGNLSRLLISNGYAYDLVNDDVLQRRSKFDGQSLHLGRMTYQVLIIPNIRAMPLESLRRVEAYASQGGIVIALECVPEASCGLRNWEAEDREIRQIASRLFEASSGQDGVGKHAFGRGTTYWINHVIDRRDLLDWRSSPLDPFLRVLRHHVTPDMAIDLVRQAVRENEGLSFLHRRQSGRDIYFVTNIQNRPADFPVQFRVADVIPWQWDPSTGRVRQLSEYHERGPATSLPIRLAPFESNFFVFERTGKQSHATSSTLDWIDSTDGHGVTGWTDRDGEHWVKLASGEVCRSEVQQVPAPFRVAGPWQLVLESPHFRRFETRIDELVSWTDLPQARHFSGTGVYTTDFRLPERYLQQNVRLYLDLGDVGNVAEVSLNGNSFGTAWIRGQRLEIPKEAVRGRNHLEIRVTSTLINRVAGLEKFPDVPQELQPRLGRGVDDAHSQAQVLLGFTPLPRSGLLGPVELHPYRRVELLHPGRD